jgi:AcrR family transcriptional regulator
MFYNASGQFEGETMVSSPQTPLAPGEEKAATRREPTQERSRARVERILDVAIELIAQRGSDALRMSAVAERAEISIGSLYQYFPDKSAIIRTLADRFNAQGRACVAAELAHVRTGADLREALNRSVDGYYEMFLAQPVMQDIWSGTLADKELQEMAVADVRAHADMLLETLAQLRPHADRAAMGTTALLIMQLMDATVRLAIAVEREEGDALIAAFKRMVIKAFELG